MKKIPIFLTILLALSVSQLHTMEQPLSPFKLPLTDFQSAQIELDREDFEELEQIADSLSSDASVIPAAAQVLTHTPGTNKRKNEATHYQCQAPGCEYKDNLSQLRNHILEKHVDFRFRCPRQDCVKNYKTRKALLRHVREVHPQQPELLQAPELSVEKLNELTDRFMPQLRFECNLCSTRFKFNKDRLKHLSLAHPGHGNPQKVSVQRLYKCQAPECEYNGNIASLRKHILAKHVHHRYKCPQQNCSKHFSDKNYLKKHLQGTHPDAPSLPVPELTQEEVNELIEHFMPKMQHQCRLCINSFESYKGLCHHLNSAHGAHITEINDEEASFVIPLESNTIDVPKLSTPAQVEFDKEGFEEPAKIDVAHSSLKRLASDALAIAAAAQGPTQIPEN